MENKYKITIEELKPYKEREVRFEGSDGKIYESKYSAPKDVEPKSVIFETGAIKYTTRDILVQEVEKLDLTAVIKAVNGL